MLLLEIAKEFDGNFEHLRNSHEEKNRHPQSSDPHEKVKIADGAY